MIFLDALHDPESDVREAAVKAVGKAGLEYSDIIIPELLTGLEYRGSWKVREASAKTLGIILWQENPKQIISALLKAIEDEDSAVRQVASRSLAQIGRLDPDNFIDLLKDKELVSDNIAGILDEFAKFDIADSLMATLRQALATSNTQANVVNNGNTGASNLVANAGLFRRGSSSAASNNDEEDALAAHNMEARGL